ncbi:hypothetical protein GCM10020229_20700 [Kitasatospora albolonga]|uniref:hypothetical protein n=1 Tax=Kitasatospora albolonga TaxID=68173 RepID=UPI0031EAC6A6
MWDWELSGVNLDVIGVIMMIAGLLGLVVYARVYRRRRLLGTVEAPVVRERYREEL